MSVRLGTFNLNNLFSRFNFATEIDQLPADDAKIELTAFFPPDDPSKTKLRTYQGRLVKGKPEAERRKIAERVMAVNCDVLAVQEVEDVDTLQWFARNELHGAGYRHVVLVEGNDARLIDVGLLSRLPIGAVTSWRHAVHPSDPSAPVFSRDLLQVDVLSETRDRVLLTVFNNHLKSHFVPFTEDGAEGQAKANARRQQQAEVGAQIIAAEMRADSRYAVVGDMNDPPDSKFLAPMLSDLTDGLQEAVEDRPAPDDDPPPPTRPWTHRFKESGKPAEYQLFDHVWLSGALVEQLQAAGINRRTHRTGDGSDHDPAWVDLSI